MSPEQAEKMREGRLAASWARREQREQQGEKPREWVTVAEAAREVGLTRNWINGMIGRGVIGILDVPGARRQLVRLEDVRRAVAAAYRPAKTNEVCSE
jgi:hypothetical protein